LMPPAFYRAYRHHAESGGKLALVQQIWVDDPPQKDLFNTAFVEQTRAEIRYVIDAIHSHGTVPQKHARGSGIYNIDIAQHVAGILFGRELEPTVVLHTNYQNLSKTEYKGRFVSVSNSSPSEVWLAQMLDYCVEYETYTYNYQ